MLTHPVTTKQNNGEGSCVDKISNRVMRLKCFKYILTAHHIREYIKAVRIYTFYHVGTSTKKVLKNVDAPGHHQTEQW